jgi:hypothetical protein
MVEFLIALTLLLVSAPFVTKLRAGYLIESILFTVVLVSAILTATGRRPVLIAATVLLLPTLIGRWAHQYRPDLVPPELFLIGGILFLLLVIVHLFRFILRAPFVTTEVLCASISTYLLLGLVWSFGYWLIDELIPGAFAFNITAAGDTSMQGFNGLYFSFVTLSTVGYGDITPVHSVARMLAAAESTAGLLYVAVLIARLVALHTSTISGSED